MINSFEGIAEELTRLIKKWEAKLADLPESTISNRRNSQKRNIRQIVGHMVDAASNHIHLVIHMHCQESPLHYPDYATLGTNDRWIAIQNYQEEDWTELVQLWSSLNRHMVHLMKQTDETLLDHLWINALQEKISLREMITDFPRHFKLHLNEISALINQLSIEHD